MRAQTKSYYPPKMQEHVVGDVGGIVGAAKLTAQPAMQPRMMVSVQAGDLLLERARFGSHDIFLCHRAMGMTSI